MRNEYLCSEMKVMASILTLTVLFLALKPAVDYISGFGCHGVSCCVDECKPFLAGDSNGQNDSNDCDGSACNPFLACGSSFVYSLDQSDLRTSSTVVFRTEKFMYQERFASQFLPEFWQPPKIA